MPSGEFRRVIVDVEVLGFEHVPVELLVLDLIATEVLRRRNRGHQYQYANGGPQAKSPDKAWIAVASG